MCINEVDYVAFECYSGKVGLLFLECFISASTTNFGLIIYVHIYIYMYTVYLHVDLEDILKIQDHSILRLSMYGAFTYFD